RDKILKFDGGYHGHADGLLVQAGSGPLTLGAPDSPGVPAVAAAQTLSVPFNDLHVVRAAFDAHLDEVAAVIVEPVARNMGGRREIMELIAPRGPVYQAGTLSGNPLAMAAGIATLALLGEPGVYDHLDRLAERFSSGLSSAASAAGVPYVCNRVGSMLTGFF